MAQRGRNLMALDQDYVVDAAELPTSAFSTRPLSGLKCEVVLHHAEAGLFHLMALHNFSRVLQYLSPLIVVFGQRNSHSRRPSQSQNTVAIFFAVGE
jgi:hypothetical protein